MLLNWQDPKSILKVQSLISELSENMTDDIYNIRYISLDIGAHKVLEHHKVYDTDDIFRKPIFEETFDITRVFIQMLMYIPDNE